MAVEPMGKNLLIRFDNGLELRTHLRMNGTWHRYAAGRALAPAARPGGAGARGSRAVAVCFDAPVVSSSRRAREALHPPLGGLGPDLLAPGFDAAEAVRRLGDPERADRAIAEALLDQRALAGIGNVFRSEVLFIERVDPFAPVGDLAPATVDRLVTRAAALLRAGADSAVRVTTGPAGGGAAVVTAGQRAAPARDRHCVYGRAGRPCRRCGTLIRARRHGDLPRTIYWCPACQGTGVPGPATQGGGPGDRSREVADG